MTHEKLNLRGVTEAIISAIAFGTIPLFSMPVIKEGMNSLSLLVYRFAFGCLVILGVLLFNKRSIAISKGDALRIFSLSLLYTVSLPHFYSHTLCGRLLLWRCFLKNA